MKKISILAALFVIASLPAQAAESKADCMKKEASQYFERLASVESEVESGALSEKAAQGSRQKISQQLEEKVLACGGSNLPQKLSKQQVSLLQ